MSREEIEKLLGGYATGTLTPGERDALFAAALEDQQLGGLIMWIPAGTLLTIVALFFLGKWMGLSEKRWEYTKTAALIRTSSGATE